MLCAKALAAFSIQERVQVVPISLFLHWPQKFLKPALPVIKKSFLELHPKRRTQLIRTDDILKVILSQKLRNLVVKWKNIKRDIILNDRLQ
jgi:hypothetical protein